MSKVITNDPMIQEKEQTRMNKLIRDETRHFTKHVIKGKVQSLRNDCYYCQHYIKGETS